MTACFLLDDIRTRSKLIEVGGAAALVMIVAAVAAGALSLDPWAFVLKNCLYAGAAGLVVGFIVLGILPFIERAFRITTSMTLLELADSGQPLLRRLAMEAPGTYNHSLQVATIAEAAAEAVGANSLLARVGAYYHDVGKINKADYFIENSPPGGCNRHLNLSPSVSLLIIIGHVKDGVELAKEYNLPTTLAHFIQQHHGTTLVEFFYHQACTTAQRQPDGPAVAEAQYRYPGPKPRSKEVAIVMLADAVESAARSMSEPTGSRVEALVHDLSMKRLMDGQFDECDLTMRELELIERSMMKTLLAIYHGRIAYPSTQSQAAPQAAASVPAAKSA
jgi:putative nucleotidyltransferase with HDIG domain